MPDKRYYIHLICSPDDQVAMHDGLSIFMERRAFLTRDLLQGDQESANYSRRCIDSCDFLVMLIGDSYGALTNTGVSQLHLSYIYAKTKAKPMMIMLKLHPEGVELSRQLKDFITMVEQQNSGSIYYYDDDVKMQEYIEPAYRKFLAENAIQRDPSVGWNPAQESSVTSMSNYSVGSNKVGGVDRKIATPPSAKKTLSQAMTTGIQSSNDSTKFNENISVDDKIQVSFTTHAFEGGNLSEVSMKASVTWKDILQAVEKLPSPVGQTSFQRAINEVVHTQALTLVQLKLRNVHAVSRTNVAVSDMDRIQAQLIETGWLAQTGHGGSSGGRFSYELLQLTHRGKVALHS